MNDYGEGVYTSESTRNANILKRKVLLGVIGTIVVTAFVCSVISTLITVVIALTVRDKTIEIWAIGLTWGVLFFGVIAVVTIVALPVCRSQIKDNT